MKLAALTPDTRPILPGDFIEEQRLAFDAVSAAERLLSTPIKLFSKRPRRVRRAGIRMCDFCIIGQHLACDSETCTCIHRERQ